MIKNVEDAVRFKDKLRELCKESGVSLIAPFEPHEVNVFSLDEGGDPLGFLFGLYFVGLSHEENEAMRKTFPSKGENNGKG